VTQSTLDREALFARSLNLGSLVRGGSVEPHWLADGNSFWYAEGEPDGRMIYRVDPVAGTREPFFDVERLRQVLTEYLGHPPPYAGVPFESFRLDEAERKAIFRLEGRELTLDLDTYAIEEDPFPPSEAERARGEVRLVRPAFQTGEPDVYEKKSPDGHWIVGEEQHNLTLRSTVDGRSRPLTTDGTSECTWDLLAVQWAPDSFRILAVRVDYRGVAKLPIVHWLQRDQEVEWAYYPKTGDRMPQTELYVIDILSGRQIRIDTGPEPDQLLYPAFWTPDGTEIHILKLGRIMRPATMLRADPKTGHTDVIYHEEIDTYLPQTNLDEPQQDLYWPLQDGRFVWLSARTGWSHLYLYGRDGSLIRPLTSGEFPVLRVVAIDEPGGWLYFAANGEERLYDTNIYRVDLQGEHMSRVTEGIGVHNAMFSPSRRYFVDTYSSPGQPPVVELRSAAGDLIQVLSRADISALHELGWGPPEEFVAPAADGETDLYGLLYLPSDFDPARKYPVVEYIYGGPQVINVPHTFALKEGYRALPQAVAQLGFAVMIVDGRGTRGRSQAFHAYSYCNLGQTVIPDHVAVLRHLGAERPYLDMTRVGIFGISWGGYNTLRAMLLAPEVYHVGVATNPVVDMDDHFGEWAEGVMGLRQENRKGYEEASNLAVADNLQGKLLLIHGTSDTNATFSATMKMVDALIDAGKPYDLMVMPEQNHHPAGTREGYWIETVKRYLVEHLKP
jgi:dipeptidyl aminopeptidase/acylaminoacyl peptidase